MSTLFRAQLEHFSDRSPNLRLDKGLIRAGVGWQPLVGLALGKGAHGAMKTGLWASADYLPPQSHPNPSCAGHYGSGLAGKLVFAGGWQL